MAINTGIEADPRYQIVVVVPGPAHGTITQSGIFPSNFVINYTPGANQVTPVSFSYQICTTIGIPQQCGQSAVVTVAITPVNDPPQAVPDTATVVYGQSILINVLSNDNGGANESDTVSLASVGNPGAGNGTAVVESGQVRYTAPAASPACPAAPNLPVSFTYQAQDGSGNQATGTINVTVKCPGVPELKLGEPYAYSGHTFKIDVILVSADVNVAAVDFTLNYDQCVTEPDVPADNKLADDVATTLPVSNFLFDAKDTDTPTPLPGALRVIAASTTSPASILAGPGASANRTIATLQFRALASGNIICSPVNFTFTSVPASGFTGTGGTPIDGITTPKTVPLDAAKLNNKPTSLALSNSRVNENALYNTFIGKFSTTDPDVGDTFTYSPDAPHQLSSGKFWIRPFLFNNDELAVNTIGLASGMYPITIRSTDSYGGFITKTFTIEVLDVNAAPIANDDGNPSGISVAGATDIDVLANDFDPYDFPSPGFVSCATLTAPDNKCSIVSVTNGAKGIVINQGTNLRYIPTDAKFTGTDTFRYTITDNDAPNALTASAKVTVSVGAEVYPVGHPLAGQEVKLGDCNASGTVEAGDLTATGLEIFDGDGSLWYDIYKGTYKNFNPRGCNSNQDNIVDAGDIACTAAKIFNPAATCSPVTSASNSVATLTISGDLSGAPGSTVNVPISLSAAGNSVAAAAFAVDFDSAALSFDSTDANSDGLPDAVQFNVPSGLMTSAAYNAAESRVEIIITGLMPPFPLLSDGTIATVSLTINGEADNEATAVALSNGSLGSDEGASIPMEVVDGTIDITGQSPQHSFYLPLITAE